MKKLIGFLVLFSIMMCFFGCQDNQVTEPVTALDKPGNIPGGGVIRLDSPVFDPAGGQGSVVGMVSYKMYRPPVSSEDPVTQFEKIQLTINMDAMLVDQLGTSLQGRWLIKGTSVHNIIFKHDGVYTVHKSYPIKDRDDIVLIVKYGVEMYKVSIQKMYVSKRTVNAAV